MLSSDEESADGQSYSNCLAYTLLHQLYTNVF